MEKYATFLELLRSGETIECDLIIGDSDMPASFNWTEDSDITEHGVAHYKPIMEAPYTRLKNDSIEIHCEEYRLGEDFPMSYAGYTGQSRYDSLFGDQ